MQKVEDALECLKVCDDWGERAYDRIREVPLHVQFPACAVAAGYPPTRGNDTGNDAEVLWTMAKAIRKKANFMEQMVAAVAMCKYQQQ